MCPLAGGRGALEARHLASTAGAVLRIRHFLSYGQAGVDIENGGLLLCLPTRCGRIDRAARGDPPASVARLGRRGRPKVRAGQHRRCRKTPAAHLGLRWGLRPPARARTPDRSRRQPRSGRISLRPGSDNLRTHTGCPECGGRSAARPPQRLGPPRQRLRTARQSRGLPDRSSRRRHRLSQGSAVTILRHRCAHPGAVSSRATAFRRRSHSDHETGPVLTSLRAVASSVGPVPNDGHHRATPHAPQAGLRA